ncbi:MAG: hypothetical protein WC365_09985 [Candidatus Babeliales bacterium]|jgi:transposase-like protein
MQSKHTKKNRRVWTIKEKQKAVALIGQVQVITAVITIKDVAELLKVPVNMVWRWREELKSVDINN